MPAEAASPFALSTPQRFLDYFGEPADESGAQTDRAQKLINAYSKAINKYVRRQFKPAEDEGDKIFAYDGTGYLSLAPYEARVINTVTLYTDLAEAAWLELPAQTTTSEARWRPAPRNRTDEGTYWSLILPELGPFNPWYDDQVIGRRMLGFQVTVNADWGIGEEDDEIAASVPEDVELALWIAVANAWRNPEAYGRRSLGPLSFQDAEGGDMAPEGLSLPRAARALLAGYRRRSVR